MIYTTEEIKSGEYHTDDYEWIDIDTISNILNEEQFHGSRNYDVGCIKGVERIEKIIREYKDKQNSRGK